MDKIWKEDFKSVDELLLKLKKHQYWKMIDEETLRLIFNKLHENSVHIPKIVKASQVEIDDMQRIRDFLIVSEEYDLVKNNYVELAKSEIGMGLGVLSMFAVTLERLGASIAQDYPYSHLDDEEVKQVMFMAELSYQSSLLCDRYLFESYFGVIFCCCAFLDIETAQLWEAEFDHAVECLNKTDESKLNYFQKTLKEDFDRINNVKKLIEQTIKEHRSIIKRSTVDSVSSTNDLEQKKLDDHYSDREILSISWGEGIYNGQTTRGKPHGNGTWVRSDGKKYVGKWMDGKKQGKGIMYFPDGVKYDGEWEDDKPKGKGTIEYSSGGKYIGEVCNGKRHGQGVYQKSDGNIIKGLWNNNQFVKTTAIEMPWEQYLKADYALQSNEITSNGVLNINLDDGVYTGQVKDGQPHGQGKQTWSNGDEYKGSFRVNEFHGWGTYTWSDGEKYEGEWEDGLRHGKGTMHYENGSIEDGFWREDKYIGSQKSEADNSLDSSVPQTRAWVRYFARMTDSFLFGMILILIIMFIYPDFLFSLAEIGIFATLFVLSLWIFIEALLLASLGTTPGKFLLSTYVKDIRGNNLTYSNALSRSFQVFMRGLAFGITPFHLITMIIAYRNLTSNQLGMATWDREGYYRVRHGPIRPLRVVFLVVIWVGIILFNLY